MVIVKNITFRVNFIILRVIFSSFQALFCCISRLVKVLKLKLYNWLHQHENCRSKGLFEPKNLIII